MHPEIQRKVCRSVCKSQNVFRSAVPATTIAESGAADAISHSDGNCHQTTVKKGNPTTVNFKNLCFNLGSVLPLEI